METYAIKPPLPYTPGSDAAGVVEAVGEGVTRVKPGDRVYTARTVSGAYAEYTLALESQVHALPEKIPSPREREYGFPMRLPSPPLFIMQRRGPVKPC